MKLSTAHAGERDGEQRGRDLADELDRRVQVEDVVERADQRDERRAGEDAAVHGRSNGSQISAATSDAGEDRHAAEPRRRPVESPRSLGASTAPIRRRARGQRRHRRA